MLGDQGVYCLLHPVGIDLRAFFQKLFIIFISYQVFPQGDFVCPVLHIQGTILLTELGQKLHIHVLRHITGRTLGQTLDQTSGHTEEVFKETDRSPFPISQTEYLSWAEQMASENKHRMLFFVAIAVCPAQTIHEDSKDQGCA